MVLQGYYAMGKTPIKHTLAGYIIKKTDTGAAGSEIFNHLIFVKQRMICIFHTLLLGRAHISWITYNIPVK